MDEYLDDLDRSKPASWFTNLPPYVRAALVFAIPFIIADFFNYYTMGAALLVSFPILVVLYAGCGALASKFAGDQGSRSAEFPRVGAAAGLSLWLASTLVNLVIGLLVGTVSLGTTLLLGLPYLCLCAPFQLIGGGLTGAFGGFIYGRFHKGSSDYSDDGNFYG